MAIFGLYAFLNYLNMLVFDATLIVRAEIV